MSSASITKDDVSKSRRFVKRRLQSADQISKTEHTKEQQQLAARTDESFLFNLSWKFLSTVAPTTATPTAAITTATTTHDLSNECTSSSSASPTTTPHHVQPLFRLAGSLLTRQRVWHGLPQPDHHPCQRFNVNLPWQQRRRQLLDPAQPRDEQLAGDASQGWKSLSVTTGHRGRSCCPPFPAVPPSPSSSFVRRQPVLPRHGPRILWRAVVEPPVRQSHVFNGFHVQIGGRGRHARSLRCLLCREIPTFVMFVVSVRLKFWNLIFEIETVL